LSASALNWPCAADGWPDPDPPRTVRARGQSGAKAVLLERLPGFPDGIARAAGGKGGFWVGLTAPSQPVVHLLPWRCAPSSLTPRYRAGRNVEPGRVRQLQSRADHAARRAAAATEVRTRGRGPCRTGCGPGSTKAGTGSAQRRQPVVHLRRRQPMP